MHRDQDTAAGAKAGDYLTLAGRLKHVLAEQVDALQNEPASGSYEEGRVKALLALSRSLQTMEELTRRLEMAADERGADAEDIVAFRERLANQLDALGRSGSEPQVSADTDT